MDPRPVFYSIGVLLVILGIGMLVPMAFDYYQDNPDWKTFFLCFLVTAFFGGALVFTNSGQDFTITVRQGFLLTAMSWIFLSLFAALPFWFSELNLRFVDSFFEAVSGITTTGSTVITNLGQAPPGILLWRAILQWLGGIGIIVMALAVLPFLKVGGMQLFKMESSESEKVLPRAAQLASSISFIYFGLTLTCMIAYLKAGMSLFDAATHAMATISTGGFSTYDDSFGHFNSPEAEVFACIFMLLGALPLVLYLKALRGNWRALFQDTQVQWFLIIVGASILVVYGYLFFATDLSPAAILRRGTFNVVSVTTGTGFSSTDYGLWGGFPAALFFFLMVIGGCAGSMTCGIKVFRMQVLCIVANIQIRQLLNPHGVFIPKYNGRPLPKEVPMSVMSFFFLFALTFSVLALALSLCGLDFLTSMSGAATSLANVGPGLGSVIGPSGTFQPLSDSAKWVLCVAMLLGRLELYALLILFSPHFWRDR